MYIHPQLSPPACANSCLMASRCCRKGFKTKPVSHCFVGFFAPSFLCRGRGSPFLDTIFSSKFYEILHPCPVNRWATTVCPQLLQSVFMGQGATANHRTTKLRSVIRSHEYLSMEQLRNTRGWSGGPTVGIRSTDLPIRPPSYTGREDICTSVYRRSRR